MYTAQTLLYLRDPIQWTDPETGELRNGELGYVHPGGLVPLPDDDPRFEIWLSIGAVVLAPVLGPAQEAEPAPARRRKAPSTPPPSE